ncbi:MAG: ferrous iron transport protein B [Verrucomicrobiae bacterium]|nr:ferrous iron transport protein B [Verrucomicrobiae bacterium]
MPDSNLPGDEDGVPHIALVGNPNSGKSTLFNLLTGLRQKVANYPGVTVEKKEGVFALPGFPEIHAVDLPGTYSLNPRSPDEEVAHDVVLGLRADTRPPDLLVAVVDAGNLERNLFFASQLFGVGRPLIIALNMMDMARAAGIVIDVPALRAELGVPVIAMSANRGEGLAELRAAIAAQLKTPSVARERIPLAPPLAAVVDAAGEALVAAGLAHPDWVRGESLRLISSQKALAHRRLAGATGVHAAVEKARDALAAQGVVWHSLEATMRYRWIEAILRRAHRRREASETVTDRLDRVLTHRVWGPAILLLVVFAVFATIFSLAEVPMAAIEGVFSGIGRAVAWMLPEGLLRDLLTDGILAGVGSVLVFLPQIMLLFLFLGILEDSGYMARVAFIMDRVMGRVGLHGKAFIPLVSSFACAIPGVMATRTIENARDRLVTILVAPLMCCSARWPVYFLLAGAFIPPVKVLGAFPLPAVLIFTMVVLGAVAAVLAAGVFRRTLARGESPSLILELPPYRIPAFGAVVRVMVERGWVFVKNAGTIILAISVLLWALSAFPRREGVSPSEQVRQSYAGKIGHFLEPVIRPLGFDWKIGIAIVASFAAREVFVSSMGTIYGVEAADADHPADLRERLRAEKDSATGQPFFTPLRAVSLMVYYVLAMQCMSTVAVVRRETGGWKWPIFQIVYMSGLAWIASFLVWHVGHWMGYS